MTKSIGHSTGNREWTSIEDRIIITLGYENSPLDNARPYLYHLIVLHKKKLEAAPVAWSACYIQIGPSASWRFCTPN